MKKFERFVARPVSLVVGIVLLVLSFQEAASLSDLGRVLTFLGGALVVIHVVMVIAADRFRSLGKTITVRTDEGESTIAIEALEGILRDEVRKANDVHDVDVDLSVDSEEAPIKCLLRFKLDSQPDIPGRTDTHKRTVREAFARLIPGKQELDISCSVADIVVQGKKKKNADSKGEEKKDSNDFSGPVYPVAEDGEDY